MKMLLNLLLALSINCIPELLQAQVYRYDFGAKEAPQYEQVGLEHVPGNLRWLAPPQTVFSNEEFRVWRFPHWLDGVAAPRLQWEMSLPNGEYELQLFLNTGLELTTTWKVSVQGKSRPLLLHPVRDDPEPGTRIAPQVKIWRGRANGFLGEINH